MRMVHWFSAIWLRIRPNIIGWEPMEKKPRTPHTHLSPRLRASTKKCAGGISPQLRRQATMKSMPGCWTISKWSHSNQRWTKFWSRFGWNVIQRRGRDSATWFLNYSMHTHQPEIIIMPTVSLTRSDKTPGCQDIRGWVQIARTYSWNNTVNFWQYMAYYVVAFFYSMYYVLSSDIDFPEDSDVQKVLGARDKPASKVTLEQCTRRFWRMPASNLCGLLPGVLEKWDEAYSDHMPSDAAKQYSGCRRS